MTGRPLTGACKTFVPPPIASMVLARIRWPSEIALQPKEHKMNTYNITGIVLVAISSLACVDKTIDCMDRECSSTESETGDGDGDSECVWSSIACWLDSDGPVCIGEINTTSIVVMPSSIFTQRVDSGVYTIVDGPDCATNSAWESVVCYTSFNDPNTACVGLIDGVLVPSADPCMPAPFGTVDILGLYATPAAVDDFNDLNSTPWPDTPVCGISGGDGDGDPGDGDGDGDGDPGSGEPVCVVHPWFDVSCWMPWFDTHARTILACEEAKAVDAGVWSAPYDMVLGELGTATCHDVAGTEFVLCLQGEDRILLTLVAGEWVPQLDQNIAGMLQSAPPC
jgi:hypothetical protein